jgi:ATP-dependent Lon protease
VILPERNRKDLQEVPAAILANMEVTFSDLKMSEGSLLKENIILFQEIAAELCCLIQL